MVPSSRLKHCFVEWMRLLGEDGSSRGIDGDALTRFYEWIKPLQQLEADVHVQTLEIVDPYYIIDMDTLCRQLDGAFRVQEYAISVEKTENAERDFMESTYTAEEGRRYELCVGVMKKAQHVSILEYYLNDVDDDGEAEDDDEEDNIDVDDKSGMYCSMKNVLDFVFSASECEELYVTVEGDGSGLINKLIRVRRATNSRRCTAFVSKDSSTKKDTFSSSGSKILAKIARTAAPRSSNNIILFSAFKDYSPRTKWSLPLRGNAT